MLPVEKMCCHHLLGNFTKVKQQFKNPREQLLAAAMLVLKEHALDLYFLDDVSNIASAHCQLLSSILVNGLRIELANYAHKIANLYFNIDIIRYMLINFQVDKNCSFASFPLKFSLLYKYIKIEDDILQNGKTCNDQSILDRQPEQPLSLQVTEEYLFNVSMLANSASLALSFNNKESGRYEFLRRFSVGLNIYFTAKNFMHTYNEVQMFRGLYIFKKVVRRCKTFSYNYDFVTTVKNFKRYAPHPEVQYNIFKILFGNKDDFLSELIDEAKIEKHRPLANKLRQAMELARDFNPELYHLMAAILYPYSVLELIDNKFNDVATKRRYLMVSYIHACERKHKVFVVPVSLYQIIGKYYCIPNYALLGDNVSRGFLHSQLVRSNTDSNKNTFRKSRDQYGILSGPSYSPSMRRKGGCIF